MRISWIIFLVSFVSESNRTKQQIQERIKQAENPSSSAFWSLLGAYLVCVIIAFFCTSLYLRCTLKMIRYKNWLSSLLFWHLLALPNNNVFEVLSYSAYSNKHLYRWIPIAGITKDMTFHCFSHTYGTLQLSKGTDIYTVAKMLGNRDLKTTQVYAKIIDKTKRGATDKIKLNHKQLLCK